jgi:predicted ATP-dependent endonuclease of OLD family
MYGRILQALDSAFTEEADRVQAFAARIEDALDALRVPQLEQFESILRDSIRTQTNLAGLSLRLRAFDPLQHYRMLALALTEVPGGVEFSPEEMGSGVQAAITVALVHAYRQLVRESAIVAIEEPELHLHPQACRYFRRLLRELAGSGTQVMFSTHGSYFVDFTKPEDICIVRKKPGEGSTIMSGRGLGLTPEERQTLKLNSRFTPEHSEVMFASKVLVVEGAAERMAMPVALQLAKFDLDREGASVLNARGKENIPAFAKVLNQFKIPFLCIIDEDPNKPGEKERNQAVVEASRPNAVRMLSPDLESVCGVPHKFTPESALKHFQAFTDPTQIPQQIRQALDEFVTLLPCEAHLSGSGEAPE